MSQFRIQEEVLTAIARPAADGFTVESCPRPYRVDFYEGDGAGDRLSVELLKENSPLLVVDKNIYEHYLSRSESIKDIPTHIIEASEETKSINTVLEIIEFMEEQEVTKASMLYIVGGGILQDLGAFACYMFKRGIAWTFVPTTLLAQCDSSVGGKTALNHKKTKNLLALFSAPRRIIIDAGFLATLAKNDWLSGAGEMFRLSITGGPDFLDVFEEEVDAFLNNDMSATIRMTASSLSAKKAVVEFDEFELDLRRSMNYGHSFGHALEALSVYKIPHGTAVAIGILVENEISYRRQLLPKDERNRLMQLGKKIIPVESVDIFRNTTLDGVLDLLKRDKKTVGTVLKLATLERIGQIRFLDFSLDAEGEQELRSAVNKVLAIL
ncbi:MAG: 3-dehydroquinate synthase [Gammaproteobacteria bacterium]|nr:3-dehydroquinate synthase [Gammaproteobacteria bacterium]